MKICSQCAYEFKEDEYRCPRCFKSRIHAGGCTNCGKCKPKNVLKEVTKKEKEV